jgi:predicted nucleic acid-binding protein
MIVLDTNIISEIMRPKPEPSVMRWLRKQPLSVLATTAVTVAEIRYGLGRMPEGRRKNHLREQFRSFLARGFNNRILVFDATAAEAYSVIVVEREKAGQSIDAFDAMIAAIAQTNGAQVATRDVSGFQGCNVAVINPWYKERGEKDES